MVASVSKKCAFFLNKHVEGLFCFLATCSARHLISVRFRRSSAPGNEIFPASINQNHFPMIQKLNLPSINLFPISNEEFAHPKVSNAIIQFIEILMWNWCSPVPRRRSLVTLRRCGRVHFSIEFISCRCHFVSVDAFTSHHAVRSHGFKCIVVAKMHYWNFDFQFVRYHISNATTHTHTRTMLVGALLRAASTKYVWDCDIYSIYRKHAAWTCVFDEFQWVSMAVTIDHASCTSMLTNAVYASRHRPVT